MQPRPVAKTTIDRYRLVRLLGEGSMGKVFLATDPKLQREVAVKLLASDIESAETRERFRREVRAVAALKHPNIVELYDYSGEDATQLYFVMEHVPGPSLAQILQQHGPMPEVAALCVGHELAVALAHAHDHGVVHRDIKPENILMHDGRVVVTDFGIVKAVAEGNPLGVKWTTQRTRVLGTPGFMAPEQFAGDRINHQTDLFALGAVLYNLTTGHVPYEGGTVQHIYDNLRRGRCEDPRTHLQSLSPEFCQLIADCIAPAAQDRIGTAIGLRNRLRALITQHGVLDIRDTLVTYARDPRAPMDHNLSQMVDVEGTVQDLAAALRARDRVTARQLCERVQHALGRAQVRRGGRAAQLWAGLMGFGIGVGAGAAMAHAWVL